MNAKPSFAEFMERVSLGLMNGLIEREYLDLVVQTINEKRPQSDKVFSVIQVVNDADDLNTAVEMMKKDGVW